MRAYRTTNVNNGHYEYGIWQKDEERGEKDVVKEINLNQKIALNRYGNTHIYQAIPHTQVPSKVIFDEETEQLAFGGNWDGRHICGAPYLRMHIDGKHYFYQYVSSKKQKLQPIQVWSMSVFGPCLVSRHRPTVRGYINALKVFEQVADNGWLILNNHMVDRPKKNYDKASIWRELMDLGVLSSWSV